MVGKSALNHPARPQSLFVAQSLDGIQAGGTEGWDHAADQPHDPQNQRGRDQGSRSDHQTDVASFSILGEGAVQRESSHGERDGVSQNNSKYSADEGNG